MRLVGELGVRDAPGDERILIGEGLAGLPSREDREEPDGTRAAPVLLDVRW